MSRFENKVVLVTGASSGIGAAIVTRFAEEGAKLAIVGKNGEKLTKVMNDIVKKGFTKPLVISADMSNENEASEIVNKTVEQFGKLDVLVNNDGIVKFSTFLGGNMMSSYDETMKLNVRAQIYIVSLAIPHLIKTNGNIINISRIRKSNPLDPTLCCYHVSQAARKIFTQAAAKELAAYGVRVNAVSHGSAKTTPLEEESESVEVAELIMVLASDRATNITGANFVKESTRIMF